MGNTRKRHEAGSFQPHVKKGDEVLVLSGRSQTERGRVVSVDPQRERAVVEGVNTITKHQRPRPNQTAAAAQQQSGRVEKSAPVHVSNLMVVCPSCNTPTRVAHKVVDGRSQRSCKRCGELLEKK